MNIPQILASDTEILIYRKKLNLITKKVTSTILLHQMIYWYTKMGGSFYKFIEPCKNKAYSEGDSWCEELGFSRKEFSTAYKILEKLGVVTKKIDINRVTTYYVKIEVISKLLSGVYGAAESGITQMPKGDLDTTDTTSEITQIFEDEEEDKQIIPIALADLASEELEAAIKKCVTKNAKKSRSEPTAQSQPTQISHFLNISNV
jgi:DNA-binding transcriptional regulator GbsR (MarR family)